MNFNEWGGLVRILFNRKHKTVRSIMTQKSILEVLEGNMRTYMSLNSIPLPEPFPVMKQLVEEVLTIEEFSDKRAARMDQDDFLRLLAAFNAKGIHFS